MPQLVKGGKYTFGWSRVGAAGRITIPPEALQEYRLQESEKLIVLPGSRTSGGFALGAAKRVIESPLGIAARVRPDLAEFQVPQGEAIQHKSKFYCWVELHDGGVTISLEALARFGVSVADKLLVIRGSGLALGFAVRGPILQKAKKHPELQVFEPEPR